ncbi:ABC transporter permease subunit [Bacillus massilinigeriensis]|uniref:ABC transporter permease subunit n=1 Tax=Bacillus mediterraneensis TaxID=1805474 RepID=UPI0008F9295D|nr:ABC transporter permease subunit [Bacillus mediterraneensis]
MNSLLVLINKELVQMKRDYKIIWLPLVFIFLGATQPVVMYYLPAIIKAIGGGQGITIDSSMVQQEGGQIMAATLGSQFDQLGMMIIIVSVMGVIQTDKESGMLAFILTRPVSVAAYIWGKVISNYIIIILSVSCGFIVAFLYARYLFSSVQLTSVLASLFIYFVWVLFMVTFTSMISTIFNSQGIIALISIVFLLLNRMLVGVHPVLDMLNPAGMSNHAMELLSTGSAVNSLYGNLLITMLWVLVTLGISYYWITQKKFH